MSWLVRAQADDFFESYQALKKYGDTVSLTVSGPMVVNLAFALELYIKYLHCVLAGKTSTGHNILELIRKLPKEAQQEIRSHSSIQKVVALYSVQIPMYIPIDKAKQPITDLFEQQIYKISDAYEKWRYSYEKGSLHYDESIALALIEAVKSVADKVEAKSRKERLASLRTG